MSSSLYSSASMCSLCSIYPAGADGVVKSKAFVMAAFAPQITSVEFEGETLATTVFKSCESWDVL